MALGTIKSKQESGFSAGYIAARQSASVKPRPRALVSGISDVEIDNLVAQGFDVVNIKPDAKPDIEVLRPLVKDADVYVFGEEANLLAASYVAADRKGPGAETYGSPAIMVGKNSNLLYDVYKEIHEEGYIPVPMEQISYRTDSVTNVSDIVASHKDTNIRAAFFTSSDELKPHCDAISKVINNRAAPIEAQYGAVIFCSATTENKKQIDQTGYIAEMAATEFDMALISGFGVKGAMGEVVRKGIELGAPQIGVTMPGIADMEYEGLINPNIPADEEMVHRYQARLAQDPNFGNQHLRLYFKDTLIDRQLELMAPQDRLLKKDGSSKLRNTMTITAANGGAGTAFEIVLNTARPEVPNVVLATPDSVWDRGGQELINRSAYGNGIEFVGNMAELESRMRKFTGKERTVSQVPRSFNVR